jgi:hypothetical protein
MGDIDEVGSENETKEDFEGQVHRVNEDDAPAAGDATSDESEEDDFEGHKHLGAEKHLKHL